MQSLSILSHLETSGSLTDVLVDFLYLIRIRIVHNVSLAILYLVIAASEYNSHCQIQYRVPLYTVRAAQSSTKTTSQPTRQNTVTRDSPGSEHYRRRTARQLLHRETAHIRGRVGHNINGLILNTPS